MKKYLLAAIAAIVLSASAPTVYRAVFGDPSALCPPFCDPDQPPTQGGGGK